MHGITHQMAMTLMKKNSVLVHGKVIGAIKLLGELDGSAEGNLRLGVREWMTGRYVTTFTFILPFMSNVARSP